MTNARSPFEPLIYTYIYAFTWPRRPAENSCNGAAVDMPLLIHLRAQVKNMIETIIAVCEVVGALAAIGISLTLLGIGMGKIEV